jgi:hypothetical protein
VTIIGSGLSAAEGLPGMIDLANYLKSAALELKDDDAVLWDKIAKVLEEKKGLEAALLKHPPSQSLELWITRKTCKLILPAECDVIRAVISGRRKLRLTSFLEKVLKPANGLPILTPNYDRLIEVACEMAGLHVDTMAIGDYAGFFDPTL